MSETNSGGGSEPNPNPGGAGSGGDPLNSPDPTGTTNDIGDPATPEPAGGVG